MTKKNGLIAAAAGVALLAAFGTGMLVARATPAEATRNKLSFSGNIQPVPAAGAAVSFTFTNNDDSTTCTASAGTPSIDTSGNFVAEVDLTACPVGFAFDGGDVVYTIAVNGTAVGGAQAVNPVPYAKYADKVAFAPRMAVSAATFHGAFTASGPGGTTLTGYAAARAICQATLNSKTAHFCSIAQVIDYTATGAALPSLPAWGTVPGKAWVADPTNEDCVAHTGSPGATTTGTGLGFRPGYDPPVQVHNTSGDGISCDVGGYAAPLLCCD